MKIPDSIYNNILNEVANSELKNEIIEEARKILKEGTRDEILSMNRRIKYIFKQKQKV